MRQSKPKKAAVNAIQARFLKEFSDPKNRFSISGACSAAKIGRATVYRWLDSCDKFREAWEERQEQRLDVIESALYAKAIDEKDTTALIFLCKTLLKHRGYVEGSRAPVIDKSPLLAKVIDELIAGDTTVDQAALILTHEGIPLPESIKIMLSRADLSEPGSDYNSSTPEELDQRYREAIEAVEDQKTTFLPGRQAEVAQLKDAMQGAASWTETTTKEK